MADADPAAADRAKGARMASGAGLTVGLAGIFASSCCVLPLAMAGFGLGSVAAAVIPALAALRPYLLTVAVIAIAIGWVSYLRALRPASSGACAAGARTGHLPLWLTLATAVVLLALAWQPWIEPWLLAMWK